jgi:energy-coupling factor transporter ATP-binding protein EcfA2
MKLSQIACTAERAVRLIPVHSVQIEDGKPVRLTVTSTGVTIHHDTYVAACERPDLQDAEWLEAACESGSYIAELLTSAQKVIVRVLTFAGFQRWPDGRMIGVDDTTVEDVNRSRGRADAPAEVTQWLAGELTLDTGEPFAVVTAGDGEFGAEAFRLVGATIVADVRLIDDRLIVTRVTRRTHNSERGLILVRGKVSVVDATRMGRISAAEKQEIKRLTEADNAYLAVWDEYNELEREAARQAARDIGWAEYDRFRVRGDGFLEFELVRHPRSDALRERIGRDTVGLEAAAGVAFNDEETRDAVIGTAWVTAEGTIRLRPDKTYQDGTLPQRGTIAGAFTLDRIRIERRERAKARIANGETVPARQMGLILADQRLDPVGRVRRYAPLSHRVRQILGGEPTEAQVQAIDLAINSRDIVLIQGPPGTGKTRVIAAIQARLTELNKDAVALNKRVLLTSYQHDAVANLVQAADDGNLPPVKLGRAAGVDDETYLTAWINDLQARLAERYENVRPNKAVRARKALIDRSNAYRRQPFDVGSTVDLLKWLAGQLDLVGSDVVHEARRLANQLEHTLGAASTSPRSQAFVARLARSLRSTPEGYADDGDVTAMRALSTPAAFDLLTDSQRNVLEMAARGQDATIAARRLAEIKRSLLDRLLDARARSSVIATMPTVEALLQRALHSADEEVALATTPIELAVERFRDAVEHRPAAIRHSLQAHTRALAATCQQAVSSSMREAQSVLFDTVIVDEAARANPLDLMVPLSLAKERIILVGDHRQLPQLLDDSIVPRLSSRHDANVVSAVLQRSMFERLFLKLREAEHRNGTKRVITLDRQFRMHPVLGAFISRQFYAPFGERLSNGNPDASSFAHSIALYGRAACGWIDVPVARGTEQRAGTSISRPAEASIIVRELMDGLQSSSELTFGIITFYSGQVTAIWEAMAESGLAIRQGDNFDLNPSIPWLRTNRDLPRVRIGSVDAFQGREFDVVYLSTTRSRKPGSGRRSNPYGFLVLPNRLCVAMSRQRKLLVAVGDAAMMTSPEGREAVPALAAFHDLTGGEHGFRRAA